MNNEFFDDLEGQPAKRDPFGIWDDTEDFPSLNLQFDSEHPEFARGVQVGMIWQLLNGEVPEFEIPVYVSNSEMVIRMAEATGYDFSVKFGDMQSEGEDSEWMLVLFKEKISS
jgi:hypothetical protein